MIKIGIIGLGSIGSRHLKNFQDLGCEVHGYDPAKIQYNNTEDLARVYDCDGIVIASPTDKHFNHIMDVHARRKPMLVEKPLVATRHELQNVPLRYIFMVGYNLRFHSCTLKARQWLEQGVIGKPLWARFTCAQYNDREAYRRDGVILNWSHEIDLALHLLGEAEVLTAATTDREDLTDILLKHYSNECHTVVHLDYLTKPERRGFVIVGTDGSIEADLVSRQAFVKDCDGKVIHTHFGKDSFDDNYVTEAKAFLALIRKQIESRYLVGCNAYEAHAVVEICLEVKEFHG